MSWVQNCTQQNLLNLHPFNSFLWTHIFSLHFQSHPSSYSSLIPTNHISTDLYFCECIFIYFLNILILVQLALYEFIYTLALASFGNIPVQNSSLTIIFTHCFFFLSCNVISNTHTSLTPLDSRGIYGNFPTWHLIYFPSHSTLFNVNHIHLDLIVRSRWDLIHAFKALMEASRKVELKSVEKN